MISWYKKHKLKQEEGRRWYQGWIQIQVIMNNNPLFKLCWIYSLQDNSKCWLMEKTGTRCYKHKTTLKELVITREHRMDMQAWNYTLTPTCWHTHQTWWTCIHKSKHAHTCWDAWTQTWFHDSSWLLTGFRLPQTASSRVSICIPWGAKQRQSEALRMSESLFDPRLWSDQGPNTPISVMWRNQSWLARQFQTVFLRFTRK